MLGMEKDKESNSLDLGLNYDENFFRYIEKGSLLSAKEIVPLVVRFLQPTSVVDVGCGTGAWLSVFKEHGIMDILGIDGDYVNLDSIFIPKEVFQSHDLTRPIDINKKFDLVVSLEVAEHLPSNCAETFIESLTRLGPVVMFSAAIPYQGGQNHVNEQWQDYWRILFNKKGYEAVDFIRKEVWDNPKVGTWFAQNTLLYVHQDHMEANSNIKEEWKKNSFPLSVVHPKSYEGYVLLNNMSLKRTLKAMPRMILERIIQKIRDR
jgi:SAM-dependent methyltransferase